ncbi:MAG: XdhC family protein [Steroidobacteraceae bacterium]|nr:XdhC family protein [Steroidobacteraceae bacterium]
MESSLSPLLPLFERERAAGRPLVLGVVLETAGSTYRKPGALMLIAENGDYAGLLSGGCLESDLREHADGVRRTGEPRIVSYDLRGPDDLLWGLGVGCEGAMKIGLLRVSASNEWQPLAHMLEAQSLHQSTAVGLVIDSSRTDTSAGTVVLPNGTSYPPGVRAERSDTASALAQAIQSALADAATSHRVGWIDSAGEGAKVFALPLSLPPRILLLGAGPDTLPVVDFAARLGWKVTLVDHRSAYAQPAHFPHAERVVHARPDDLATAVDLTGYKAAVVMSHHLPSDLSYLRVLASAPIPYVGLLGPAIRREKLLADLGESANALRPRLRAPVGLALGGRAPESIALAIVSEIHAFVHDARGRPFSEPG